MRPHSPCLSTIAFAVALLLLGGCDKGAPGPTEAAPVAPSATASAPVTQVDVASSWKNDVITISAHKDSAGRRGAILQLLAASQLPATEKSFTHEAMQGVNVTSEVSGAAQQPLLLLGAHYDQVGEGSGVTDNAAGSAVVLELARRFHGKPLQNHRVAAAFWDLEEKGLLGATAYVVEGGEKPALYVNFDVFGWGDTLWLMSPDAAQPLVAASDSAARAAGIRFSSGDKYPPTDHLAFLKADWPAVSYSLLGQDEIAQIVRMFSGERDLPPPRVLKVIHSADDTLEQVEPPQAAKGIDAVEAALRSWDAGHGH